MSNSTRVMFRFSPVTTDRRQAPVMVWFEDDSPRQDEVIVTLRNDFNPHGKLERNLGGILGGDLEHWAPQLMEGGEAISLTELAERIEQQRPPGPVWSVILVARDFSRRVMANLNVHEQYRVVHNNDPGVCYSHDYMDPNQHMLDALAAVTGEEWEGAEDTRRGEMMASAWALARLHQWFTDPVPNRCMECNAALPDDATTYCTRCAREGLRFRLQTWDEEDCLGYLRGVLDNYEADELRALVLDYAEKHGELEHLVTLADPDA